MATAEQKDMIKRIDQVIEESWNHITPGTPDFAYIENFKRKLREAISPTPEQPATPSAKVTGGKE